MNTPSRAHAAATAAATRRHNTKTTTTCVTLYTAWWKTDRATPSCSWVGTAAGVLSAVATHTTHTIHTTHHTHHTPRTTQCTRHTRHQTHGCKGRCTTGMNRQHVLQAPRTTQQIKRRLLTCQMCIESNPSYEAKHRQRGTTDPPSTHSQRALMCVAVSTS